MKAVFFIFARNKVKDIERSMRSALSQTYTPLTIVISDQGSEDGTTELIKEIAKDYKGPNELLLLDCPKREHKGMAGLNDHINWIDENVKADVFIASSADDFSEPERTEKTVEVFEASNADMVMTKQRFIKPDGTLSGYTAFPREHGWVGLKECISKGVGGSASIAWRQDFYKEVGPIPPFICNDLYLPALACVRGGLFYISDPLHTYVQHSDPENTGLEGRINGTEDKLEKLRLGELAIYQISASYVEIMKKMIQMDKEPLIMPVLDRILSQTIEWVSVRNIMENLKLAPGNLSNLS